MAGVILAVPSLFCRAARADAAEHGVAAPIAIPFQIAPQPLGRALETYARISSREVLYDGALALDRRSAEVDGVYAPEIALQILLAGTGLRADVKTDGFFVLRPDEERGPAHAARQADEARSYYIRIQAALKRTFCASHVLPDAQRTVARLWIGQSGDVLQAKTVAAAGGESGQLDAVLRGVQVGTPPPGFAQPVTIVIRSGMLDARRECTEASGAGVASR